MIGVGPLDREYEAVDSITTPSSGTFEAKIAVPDWASAGDRLIFVVETERIMLRSDPFDVNSE